MYFVDTTTLYLVILTYFNLFKFYLNLYLFLFLKKKI